MATRRLRALLAEKRLSETGIILRSICADVGWILELVFVGTREAVQEAVGAHQPDLVLLDLALLQPDAAAYVHHLHLENKKVPLIVFGEPAEKACAEACLAAGARDYLLEGFMDERTVHRVLQAAVVAMDEKQSWNGGCAKAGETCRCALQGEAAEGSARQSITATVQEKQDELVRMLKRNVRTSDRVVPRWCGHIELVLRNATQDCAEKVIRRLRTRTGVPEARLWQDAPFRITVVPSDGVEAPLTADAQGAGEFAVEIEERSWKQ
jgi:CheY-like chemotaxis protein